MKKKNSSETTEGVGLPETTHFVVYNGLNENRVLILFF
jgi:hypothetical protein